MIRTMAGVAAVLVAGCGVTESQVDESSGDVTAEGASELGTSARTYVTLKRDLRKCVSPMCGGYWVSDLNRATPREVYVNSLDLTPSKLDQTAIDGALEAGAGELVLWGKLGAAEPRFNTRPFIVSGAWRGMPGITAAQGESFFRVQESRIECFTTPCPQLLATRLNGGGSTRVGDVAVGRASLARVDQNWLASRITAHGALVAAKFGTTANDGPLLDASQVFVKLPEAPGPCPMFKLAACPANQVRTYSRTEDRCLMPAACVAARPCTQFIAMCPAGYSLVRWPTAAAACGMSACDPSFTVPDAQ